MFAQVELVLLDGVMFKERGGDTRQLSYEELRACMKPLNHKVGRCPGRARVCPAPRLSAAGPGFPTRTWRRLTPLATRQAAQQGAAVHGVVLRCAG